MFLEPGPKQLNACLEPMCECRRLRITSYHYLNEIIDLLSFGLPLFENVNSVYVRYIYKLNLWNVVVGRRWHKPAYYVCERTDNGDSFTFTQLDYLELRKLQHHRTLPIVQFYWDTITEVRRDRTLYGHSQWSTVLFEKFEKFEEIGEDVPQALLTPGYGDEEDHWSNEKACIRYGAFRINFNYLSKTCDAIKCRI